MSFSASLCKFRKFCIHVAVSTSILFWNLLQALEAVSISAAASDIANLVGLAPDDVRSVLLHQSTAGRGAAVDAAIRQAVHELAQAEGQLVKGTGQGMACTSALLAAVEALRGECAAHHKAAALATVQSSMAGGGSADFAALEEQLRAAATEVRQLEAHMKEW